MKNIFEKMKSNFRPGLTVAMINIPLSISLAVASWATPLQWIITGIWAGIIASIFASSQHNIFGVAGALSSILLGFVLAHPENGVILLPLVAFFSGVMMLVIYFLKITKYITLLPSTALHGFLISVGITIALWQVSGALGLNDPSLGIHQHKEVFLNLVEVGKHIASTNIFSVVLFSLWLTFLIICKKFFPKFPWVITITVIWIWLWIAIDKGFLPTALLLVDKFPQLQFALFDFSYTGISLWSFQEGLVLIKGLFVISLVVTIIAIIETIISARIAEKITKVKFDKNREVLGLSLSNMGTGILGGLPNTAVFIRTALNINSWGNHKMAWFLTAIFTLIISALLFNDAFKYLPFPIISAILMNIALGLIDIWLLKKLFHIDKHAFVITVITTVFSVFWEPTYGILIGTSITLLIYLKKITSQDANISVFRNQTLYKKMPLSSYVHEQVSWDIMLLKFSWGLNYLNIEHTLCAIEKIDTHQKVIFSLSHIWNIDIDGIETLDEMISILEQKWIDVYISWVEDTTSGFVKHFHNYEALFTWNKIFHTSREILDVLLNK